MHGVRLFTTWPHVTAACALGMVAAPRTRHTMAKKETLVTMVAMKHSTLARTRQWLVVY